MLKKIFLPWAVIGELNQRIAVLESDEKFLRDAVNSLMKERLKWRPRRDKRGRFIRSN